MFLATFMLINGFLIFSSTRTLYRRPSSPSLSLIISILINWLRLFNFRCDRIWHELLITLKVAVRVIFRLCVISHGIPHSLPQPRSLLLLGNCFFRRNAFALRVSSLDADLFTFYATVTMAVDEWKMTF
jgi:hypothetical protein